MAKLNEKIVTDTWISGSWDDYVETLENPEYEKAKGYYYEGKFRLEMSPVGNDHASDSSIISVAISLFAVVKNIPLNGKDNCSYRKRGVQEAQPDLSYYIGDNVNAIPWGVGIVNLDEYPVPNLVIEIANTSLKDDLGAKRLLYEDLGIEEYWVVDVQTIQITAFTIENKGSRRIDESLVLPGLRMAILTEALRRTRQTHHTEVNAWLLGEFQK